MVANVRILVAIAMLSFAPVATLAQDTKPGDPINGKKVYAAENCYECHGTTGQGGGVVGPKLAPHPLPLHLFLRQLRKPASRMPVYTAVVLTDAQAADILAYLQTIKPGKLAHDIPLLNLP